MSKHGKLKHRQNRPDGKMFWGYNNTGGKVREMWYSPEAFDRKKVKTHKRALTYKARNPEVWLKSYLKINYGISVALYKSILKKQKGRCAICKKKEWVARRRLAVDHCHTTGKVRGLLRYLCNTAIGKFNDDPDLLMQAVKYLRKHQ